MHAIEVSHVSKVYRLYRQPADRLREILVRKPRHQAFCSLNDVSFQVPAGETLGIIGDNGAGKSSILKIVAGTLTPTAGSVLTRGRVAALLELGAGFHFEFTGRQNIWMNAALMGLDRREISARERDIIAFAELEEFIDRPIRTYSSGMVMRLAFAIATSVDPEILIVDEALSVGDQHFQRKCIARMLEFKEKRKTILFCSHAMFLVNQLCDRALWFERGRIREEGKTTHITAAYESWNREKAGVAAAPAAAAVPPPGNEPVAVQAIKLNGSKEKLTLNSGDDLLVEIEYESFADLEFFITAGIRRNDQLICHAVNMARDVERPLRGPGSGRVSLRYRALPFLHGDFAVVVSVVDVSGLQCFCQQASAEFTILPADRWEHEIGLLKLDYEWQRQ